MLFAFDVSDRVASLSFTSIDHRIHLKPCAKLLGIAQGGLIVGQIGASLIRYQCGATKGMSCSHQH
jgi:hypothetical protein